MCDKQQKNEQKKNTEKTLTLLDCCTIVMHILGARVCRRFTHSKLTSQLATSSGRLGECSKCIKPINIGKHKSTSSKRWTTTTTTTMLAARTATFMITKMRHQQLPAYEYTYICMCLYGACMWQRSCCCMASVLNVVDAGYLADSGCPPTADCLHALCCRLYKATR